jgi:transposase
MVSMTIHIKNIKGHDYAYDVKTFWDKEQKKYKKQTKYLGTVTSREPLVYERKRNPNILKENLILDYGDSYLLYETAKNSGLADVFSDALTKERDTLWALLFFKMLTGLAFMYTETWYHGNYASILFSNATLASQRVTEFLKRLGSESVWRVFFTKYLNAVTDKECGVIIDSTGLPNEINFPLSQFGHHGGETEREMRLIMVVDQTTRTPLYFRYVAGNIIDVSTLETTIAELGKMGVKSTFALLDAGYYSESNIKSLYEANIDFLTRMPAGRVLFKQLITQTAERLEKARNSVIYNGRSLFIERVETDMFGKKGFAYVVCDLKRKLKEMDRFLLAAQEDKLTNDEIDEAIKFKGKFVLLTNRLVETADIIPLYYTRQSAERMFGIAKSNLDTLPLRTHSENVLRGTLLLNFMALALFIQLQKSLGAHYTVEDALLEARNLRCKVFDNGILIAEPNKRFKEILLKLGITVPNKPGI